MIRKIHKRALTSLVLMLVTASTAKQSVSAVEQFQNLQAMLRESRTSSDWYSYLTNANKLKELLNEAPDSLLEVARADLHVGDLNLAFRELEQFVRMGQSTDLLASSSDFAALVKRAEFIKIQSGMKANRSPISLGSTAFLLPDRGLLAEDLDYDPRTNHFFITSVLEKKSFQRRQTEPEVTLPKRPMTGQCWPSRSIPRAESCGQLRLLYEGLTLRLNRIGADQQCFAST